MSEQSELPQQKGKQVVTEPIRLMTEKAVLDYERYMYNHEFHRISYVLDDFIRGG